MKKIFTLIAAMLLVPWVGWGQEETIEISTADDLYAFAERVDEGETSLNAILMNSIVINENVLSEDGHLNISNPERWKFDRLTYSGTFDGQGNTISGFYSSNPFLGTLKEGGVIKNLGIIDSYFYMANGYSCAIFCSTNEGTISNCWNSGTLDIGQNSNDASKRGSRIGIFCETNEGTIEGCHNEGYIYSAAEFYEGYRHIGGICGMNSGIIHKCYNVGKISIKAEDVGAKTPPAYCIGGIAGGVEGDSEEDHRIISECYNAGEIIVYGGDKENEKNSSYILIGGIIGKDYAEYMLDIIPAEINSCYNIGTCTVNNLKCIKDIVYSVGGITGASMSPTKDCYSIGNILGNDKSATFILLGNLFSTNLFGGFTTLENLSYTNCYYEKKVENIGYYADTDLLISGNPFVPITELEGTIEKDNDAFQSGEVAWLLYKGGYGQRIGTDKHPVLINLGNEGTEVYKLNLNLDDVSEEANYPTFVNHGTKITPFEDLTLEEGQTINWYKDGERVAEGLTYTVNKADADEDAIINLTAKIENVYTIKTDIQPVGAGIIEVPEKAQEDDEISFKVAANEGYKQAHVSAATDAGEAIALTENEGTYTFTMPAANVTITATFEKEEISDDDDEGGIGTKRYQLFLADQDFYLNDEYDAEGLVLYSLHDKRYTKAGSSFTVWFEKHGEVNEGARVFISNRANGEYKEVKLDEVSGYYQIRNVQSNIYVKLYTEEGFPVANESIEATDARAYAQANKIVVITPEPTDVQIISMAGAVVASAQVAGQQEFANLAEGVYIVRMGKEIIKLQVRN